MPYIETVQIIASSPNATDGTKPERSPLERTPIPFESCPCGQSIIVPIWFSEGSLRVRVDRVNKTLADSEFVILRHSTGALIGFELAHRPKQQQQGNAE